MARLLTKVWLAVTATKRCARCRLELPIEQFGHDGRTRDRLTYRCNDCRAVIETQTGTFDHHGDL